MLYPARFEFEDGSYNVSFRDIPEALTCGDNYEDALEMAKDALLTSMDFYFEDHRKVPLPSPPQEGEVLIELPTSIFAKVLLLNEMVDQNISNVELAKRIAVKPQEVQRITNLGHSTKIDTIARAINALDKQFELRVV
ncbi:type II toxin-antitoxin system HicB family antitoxin [Glaesserella parasuis]|uniref:Type II toxin-antitoxin system HicB family antitoxin n=2 Tax=Glaesserella parasuis TaxID=738 RepID=A0A143CEF9_GLAPU|nr:type II toxin-antitoxin system HicB family antitoxin [Glaesserella parasuis]EQA06319.1 antitoxin HicB [Glaesserella parasuis 12939]EQA14086.1 antitoxin HicB [Glaesserella parasuis H465]AMW15806.1 antitoxin [Glaesserella parasuis]MCT8517344.1 type II toxin-antitoxin system HicB family antitoxin [Glaesserella parasuis]MCT8526859.1 type II toxin-antitoxin system HicB family antitoxin [Glaesserella parasuis]